MANIDNSNTGLTENHAEEEHVSGLLSSSNVSEEHSAVAACALKTSSSPPLISPTNSSTQSRTQLALPASDSSLAAPHPKKFTSVNINKKFLQKNSSSSGSATTSSNHVPVVKSGSPAPVRPVAPPISTHSRLVTTKLTAAPVSSTTTGPGWSRPPSAAPPVSSTPSTSSNGPPPQPLPHAAAPAPVSIPAAPQLPVAGKVIQPQPRAIPSTSSATGKKDTTSKPAWGHLKVVAPVLLPDSAGPSDFPTAAEVAHGRPSPKVTESQKPSDAPHSKSVTLEEADAFRGVHLDPNAHHWDEMEEDDDHFLDGVIEFGDGRQYKISPAEASAQNVSSPDPATDTVEPHPEIVDSGKAPVSKEDRFADDFDRRWPRSRPSPSFVHKDLPRAPRHPSMSPVSSHPSYSPSEGSRVLFNERSNRLEPYSSHPNTRHLPGAPISRRGSHIEHISPPVDMRSGRDGPMRSPVQPVQLLQKPAGNYDRSSRTSRNGPGPHVPFGRTRDGLPSLSMNGPPNWDGLPSVSPIEKHEIMLDSRGRRLSNMGPPPLPSLKRDATRQRPPHISTAPPGKLFARDPHQPLSASQQHLDSPTTTHGGSVVGQSPLLSTISVTSETAAPFMTPTLSIEDAHKTAMHISAERAKQRRQVEEEEREKEKERARQKAAALEEKFKAHEEKKNAQEAEAVKLIQEVAAAAKSPSQQALQLDATAQRPTPVRPIGRPPSLRASVRPPMISRPIVPSNAEQSHDSSKTNSWRSKAPPPSSPPALRETPVQPRAPAPLLRVEEFITVSADEDLEVVDFSDMGKFVGAPAAPQTEAPHEGNERPSRPSRPVASDFFEDSEPQTLPPHPKSPNVWRRKTPTELVGEVSAPSASTNQEIAKETAEKPLQDTPVSIPSPESLQEAVARISPSKSSSTADGLTTYSSNHTTLPTSPQRLTRPAFRVRMSALDDVMSRIKGALDDMKETESAKQAIKETADAPPEPNIPPSQGNANGRGYSGAPKWLPPALRPRRVEFGEEHEVFDVTGCEPPRSPRLTAVVRLPSQSRPLDPIPKRQARFLKNVRSQFRWDIMSWDPPVEGMSKKDFSLNDVLHRSHLSPRGKPRFRVHLPRARHNHASFAIPLGPKVNLPVGSTKPGLSYGRSKVDDLPSWRRVAICPSIPENSPDGASADALDTISCSPPPNPPELTPAAQSVLPCTNKAEAVSQRPRAQPKMPVGSAVAFYRDIPSDTASQELKKHAVSFTVFSELDEIPASPQSDPPSALFSSAVDSSESDKSFYTKETVTISRVVNGLGKDTSSPRLVVSTQLDSKSSDESVDRNLITPGSTSYSTPWTKSPLSFSSAKESPARAPDPEHLKAVWSQPSDKALVHAVNSLEGIADDLTALPFTLQDVKSEDGETPPPTSAANVPSKMSLHDVTRAFQQVPTSSNAATRSSSTLPSSSVAGPISRPSNYTYSPVHPPGMSGRPPFPYSPMMAHPPSPTPLVYPPPSPAPRGPNGHSPMFGGGQPIWVPLPSQSHSGAVRPVTSPYPTQLMAYPSPNGVPSMYGPPPMPHGSQSPPQINGAAQPRPRNMPVMSPVLHSATPSHANHSMYAGSPVMMHALPMMAHGPQPYMAVTGRGQGRPDGMPPMQQSHSAPQPSHATMYSPAQPLPYGRPSW
ncbi:uncharacterized protein F5147DRAFT_626942 [Suillus discolor]|uniref:Uncharacterized protein n=1 Tax=Suillus discolor TaxID=1912936 RepID=A0A9P7JZA8_9AGAM|nr:uncharacterized protein F5147DRAFT_626942 [Suillus discolor]KAG2117858.1 hypothetical protein F5147DRAFT_626942 [Suillus discolor]